MDNHHQDSGQGVEPVKNQLPTNQTAEKQQQQPSMESLLGEEGLGLEFPKQGEIRTGVIASIGENEILVSIGTKSEGIISGRELDGIPSEERNLLQIGNQIPVYVVQPEDDNGNVVLSFVRAQEEQDWESVTSLLESAAPVETQIVGYNKGGLLVPVGGLRGFVPASQISLVRRSVVNGDTAEQRWGKMVDEPITVRVIEVDRERRRLILSERLALQETRESLKDRLLDELKIGDVRNGRVTSIADFGAFVNIDGADGLVHLSEISWERINHPNEVLRVGQEIQVKIISIDPEKKRIGLSLRQLLTDPWQKKVEHLREGQLIEGTITHLTKFGAFARLSEELEGLIHLSEISEQRITHPKEVVKEGDVVTLRIIKIDPERRRIALSLRKVDSPAYADLDWKMALSGEVEGVKLVEETEGKEATDKDVQAVLETSEMVEAASPGQDVTVEETPPAHDETEEAASPEQDEIVEEAPPAQDETPPQEPVESNEKA